MLLPLKRNCRAVIIHTTPQYECYKGNEVTAVRPVDHHGDGLGLEDFLCAVCNKRQLWEISASWLPPAKSWWLSCACSLMRIDGLKETDRKDVEEPVEGENA